MLKEKIENIPGGKEIMEANKNIGYVVGGLTTSLLTAMVFTVMIGRYSETGTLTPEVIFMALVASLVLSAVFSSVTATIGYYRHLNKANNVYMEKLGGSHE